MVSVTVTLRDNCFCKSGRHSFSLSLTVKDWRRLSALQLEGKDQGVEIEDNSEDPWNWLRNEPLPCFPLPLPSSFSFSLPPFFPSLFFSFNLINMIVVQTLYRPKVFVIVNTICGLYFQETYKLVKETKQIWWQSITTLKEIGCYGRDTQGRAKLVGGMGKFHQGDNIKAEIKERKRERGRKGGKEGSWDLNPVRACQIKKEGAGVS